MSLFAGITSTQNSNTPAIASSTTALVANGARMAWSIQNLGTNPLYVLLGTGASTSVFHYVLKGGSGNDDGSAGSITQTAGAVYVGTITVAGTSPRYTVLEIAP